MLVLEAMPEESSYVPTQARGIARGESGMV